uniref:Uncharacterized protein n=1 Tax=Glossina palpalis gambiensis TaxID=67801 RepID=A0A1B0BV45_9MUSC
MRCRCGFRCNAMCSITTYRCAIHIQTNALGAVCRSAIVKIFIFLFVIIVFFRLLVIIGRSTIEHKAVIFLVVGLLLRTIATISSLLLFIKIFFFIFRSFHLQMLIVWKFTVIYRDLPFLLLLLF